MKNLVVQWGFKVLLMSMFLGLSPSSVGASNNTTNMASTTANPAGDGGVPVAVNKKNQLRGVMFKYGPNSVQVAFKTDATEIDELVCYLINKEHSEAVVLVGHSTGCQDIVYYLRLNSTCSRAVRAAILQATVSDREFLATLPDTASKILLASKLISQGRGSELMPRETESDDPITAYRYHSLSTYNGDDDLFSSDLSEEQLKQRLGHMSRTPCQIIFSMNDEFLPKYVDKKALVDRLSKAMGGAEKVEIEEGNHSLSNRVQEAVQAMIGFITERRT